MTDDTSARISNLTHEQAVELASLLSLKLKRVVTVKEAIERAVVAQLQRMKEDMG